MQWNQLNAIVKKINESADGHTWTGCLSGLTLYRNQQRLFSAATVESFYKMCFAYLTGLEYR